MAGSPMGLTKSASARSAIPFCQYPIKNSIIERITNTDVPRPMIADEMVVIKASVPRKSRKIFKIGISVIRMTALNISYPSLSLRSSDFSQLSEYPVDP